MQVPTTLAIEVACPIQKMRLQLQITNAVFLPRLAVGLGRRMFTLPHAMRCPLLHTLRTLHLPTRLIPLIGRSNPQLIRKSPLANRRLIGQLYLGFRVVL